MFGNNSKQAVPLADVRPYPEWMEEVFFAQKNRVALVLIFLFAGTLTIGFTYPLVFVKFVFSLLCAVLLYFFVMVHRVDTRNFGSTSWRYLYQVRSEEGFLRDVDADSPPNYQTPGFASKYYLEYPVGCHSNNMAPIVAIWDGSSVPGIIVLDTYHGVDPRAVRWLDERDKDDIHTTTLEVLFDYCFKNHGRQADKPSLAPLAAAVEYSKIIDELRAGSEVIQKAWDSTRSKANKLERELENLRYFALKLFRYLVIQTLWLDKTGAGDNYGATCPIKSPAALAVKLRNIEVIDDLTNGTRNGTNFWWPYVELQRFLVHSSDERIAVELGLNSLARKFELGQKEAGRKTEVMNLVPAELVAAYHEHASRTGKLESSVAEGSKVDVH